VLTTPYLLVDFVDALADHVLDRYQHAMRYFGLLAPSAKRAAVIFALLEQIRRPHLQRLGWANSLRKYFRVDPLVDSHGNPCAGSVG